MTLESSPPSSSRSNSPEHKSREELVKEAVLADDIIRLQELSMLPGGFGNGRKYAWPYLLGCSLSDVLESSFMTSSLESLSRSDIIPPWRLESPPKSVDVSEPEEEKSTSLKSSADLPSHPDEHQVQLDTNRSFILYPVVSSSVKHRKLLQVDLHDIILGVLRKRPKLRYFQGYHDIITVLFLTLPPEYVLPCAEKISLHRLRDAMGNGLEPLVGQLRILKRLVKIADPAYGEVLAKNGNLPYYALSNLLTLFSHDMPTLPLIQHVFDWLLCREPAASIWLETVIIISKKDEILKLAQEGDDAMGLIHAALTTLPPLSDEVCDTELFGIFPTSDTSLEKVGKASPKAVETEVRQDDGAKVVQEDQSFTKEEESSEHVVKDASSESSRELPGAYKEKEIVSVPLCDLLRQASDLLVQYPPSLPELRVSQTFGFESILHKRDIDTSFILPALDDDIAESFVGGDEVILPLSQEEQDEELGITKEKPMIGKDEKPRRNEKLTKEHKKTFIQRLIPRRQVVIASTVLLIGVAVAVYGLHPNYRNPGRGGNGIFMSEHFRWFGASVASLFGTAAKFGIMQ
ncbi:hypothetical protein Clacol_009374 [Clathrus columnatus]|uniref:Rab-GAP TBC domain-containing protein n=1 Tax=Clathrus columnatus TaxID=1419009 RepID=A0AAV5AQW5_9AGAM|nr:hypothetical protein Clacol_009374 [Clathrus columnatus]